MIAVLKRLPIALMTLMLMARTVWAGTPLPDPAATTSHITVAAAAANGGCAVLGTVPATKDAAACQPPDRQPAAQDDYINPQPYSDFNLPQIGEAGANVITPQQEYQVGVQVMNELHDAGAILDDPLIHEYIDNLGHELSSHSDNPTLHFEYFVLNDPEINAVTLPGGFIGVNSGLILQTDNEDELAGVMAHETGHVTQRHLARSLEDQKDRSLLNIATMLGAILVAANAGDPNTAMGTIAAAQASIIQHQINFTRADEAEADRVGIQTMARAGFPPQGMINFFEKMQRSSALNGYDRIPEFLMTHPLDLTRMAEAENRAQSLHVPPRPDSRNYALMKARLQVLESDDMGKTLQLFTTGIASAHGWNQEAMRYGLALAYTRLDRDKDAIAIMRQLQDKYDDVIAFHIGLADALMAGGRTAAAETTYQQAMQLFPDNEPLVLSYARDLIEANQPQRAITLLLSQSLRINRDPESLRLVAKAYEKAGDTSDSHYYMSEYYLVNGLPAAAADQLRIALATPGVSSMQTQRYRARLERLEAEARANHQRLVTPGT
ncbi:MAG: M48 family metallopeptidase [Gammaproteobacteria bacterium]|nr:M48 family metallopeptidase [Gammaproteobacteria bacterium]